MISKSMGNSFLGVVRLLKISMVSETTCCERKKRRLYNGRDWSMALGCHGTAT